MDSTSKENLDFTPRLVELGDWLVKHDALWRERPFIGLPVSWEKNVPEVAAALRALPLEVIERCETEPWKLPDMPLSFQRWGERARAFSARPLLKGADKEQLGSRPRRVPDRKWRQVVPFVQVVLERQPQQVSSWVDWCSGKGHLGRTLAQVTGLSTTFVERNHLLCEDGQGLAVRDRARARFIEADVLQDGSVPYGEILGKGVGVVSLHACGQLHRELFLHAASSETSFLAVAPCCHHAIPRDSFQPLSEVGASLPLALGRHQLRLVGLHEVVATERRQLLRRREQAWRLALDLLLREATGEDRYRPLGSVPRSWLRLEFEEFCRKLLDRAGSSLPSGTDYTGAEPHGWERLHAVRGLGMVRGLFREPLEAWLLLDQAKFLEERGWRVRLGNFCSTEVTPRKGMIIAER